MAMTVVATRNASARVRGFLASCCCEIAPGVYTAPRMSDAVRERVWAVVADWTAQEPDSSIVMTWPDRNAAAGQSVRVIGAPACDLVVVDGMVLVRRPLPQRKPEAGSLKTE